MNDHSNKEAIYVVFSLIWQQYLYRYIFLTSKRFRVSEIKQLVMINILKHVYKLFFILVIWIQFQGSVVYYQTAELGTSATSSGNSLFAT
jgi:hypothetical protein